MMFKYVVILMYAMADDDAILKKLDSIESELKDIKKRMVDADMVLRRFG